MMKPFLTLSVMALGATAACTPMTGPQAAGQQPRECFFVQEVQSFASADDRVVFLRTGRNEVFRLETIGCSNVDWAASVGIQARGGGSSICSALDADLIVPDIPGGARRCSVTDVRRLTDTEVAALTPDETP